MNPISTGRMRAVARDLRRQALANPMERAPRTGVPHPAEHFARVDRELTWGLTLNK